MPPTKPGRSLLLVILGGLLLLCGVLVGILFGISGYYMIARPIHSAGPDAKPVAALVVGVLFAASVALAGIVLIRRGRR